MLPFELLYTIIELIEPEDLHTLLNLTLVSKEVSHRANRIIWRAVEYTSGTNQFAIRKCQQLCEHPNKVPLVQDLVLSFVRPAEYQENFNALLSGDPLRGHQKEGPEWEKTKSQSVLLAQSIIHLVNNVQRLVIFVSMGYFTESMTKQLTSLLCASSGNFPHLKHLTVAEFAIPHILPFIKSPPHLAHLHVLPNFDMRTRAKYSPNVIIPIQPCALLSSDMSVIHPKIPSETVLSLFRVGLPNFKGSGGFVKTLDILFQYRSSTENLCLRITPEIWPTFSTMLLTSLQRLIAMRRLHINYEGLSEPFYRALCKLGALEELTWEFGCNENPEFLEVALRGLVPSSLAHVVLRRRRLVNKPYYEDVVGGASFRVIQIQEYRRARGEDEEGTHNWMVVGDECY